MHRVWTQWIVARLNKSFSMSLGCKVHPQEFFFYLSWLKPHVINPQIRQAYCICIIIKCIQVRHWSIKYKVRQ
jgi:hypothetical protein